MLRQQFRAGVTKAYEKFIDHTLVTQFDEVLALADKRYLKERGELIKALGSQEEVGDLPYQIADYKMALKLSIAEKSFEIAQTTEDTDVMKKVITHKHSTRDQIKDKKRNKQKP